MPFAVKALAAGRIGKRYRAATKLKIKQDGVENSSA
jgi:hypothetical protein